MRSVAAPFLVSRAVVWVAGILAGLTLETVAPRLSRPIALGETADLLAGPAVRWDATWYLEIAREGYASELHAAFFPLYPLTVRAVSWVVASTVVAGILVSLVAFAGALVALRRLTELELGPRAAERTVWLIALYPAALFFSAVYAESLFLLLSVTAFLAAREGRWRRAALLGMLAGATRNSGWLLIVPLGLMYWQERRRVEPDALWLGIVPLGTAAFGVYQWIRFGDPLTGTHAERWWGRELVGPFRGLWEIAENLGTSVSQLVQGVDVGSDLRQLALAAAFGLALVAFVGVVRRLPAAYWAWTAIGLLAIVSAPLPDYPLSGGSVRYVAVLFPLFMWAGCVLTRRWLYLLVLAGFGAGLALVSAQFSTWHFVA